MEIRTTGQMGVLATCMPMPSRIVVSCDPNSTEKDQRCMEKCGILPFGGIQWLVSADVVMELVEIST